MDDKQKQALEHLRFEALAKRQLGESLEDTVERAVLLAYEAGQLAENNRMMRSIGDWRQRDLLEGRRQMQAKCEAVLSHRYRSLSMLVSLDARGELVEAIDAIRFIDPERL